MARVWGPDLTPEQVAAQKQLEARDRAQRERRRNERQVRRADKRAARADRKNQ